MVQTTKRRWLQFSLKSLLGLSLLFGVFIAWLAHSSRQYETEQRLIQVIESKLPKDTMMTIDTNGQKHYARGIMAL